MLNYKIFGSIHPPKKNVVLLHGFCEDLHIWTPLAEQLANNGLSIVSIDLPGFGESKSLQASPQCIDAYAEAVQKTLEALGIDYCIMAGHSLGGYVTLAFAEKHPEMLKGIGLFHSTAFEDRQEKKENRGKSASFIEKYGTEKFLSGVFAGLFSSNNRELYASDIQSLTNKATALPSQSLIDATIAMRERPDRRALLSQLDIPILFAIGKEDQAIPFADSLAQCHLPKRSLAHIWGGVGHMGMIEAFHESLQALRGLINMSFQ